MRANGFSVSVTALVVVCLLSAACMHKPGAPSSGSPARCPGSEKVADVVADVVAIDHPMVFNRLGAQNVNWMMYALRHDVIDVKSQRLLDYSPEGDKYLEAAAARNSSRGIALRPDLRPRPLVLRVAKGELLKVRFTNLLEVPSSRPANPYNSYPDPFPGVDHPLENAPKDPAGTSSDKRIYHIDDQVASRHVGFNPQGLELAGNITNSSTNTGKNPNTLAAPGETREYCFYAPEEGAFLVSNDGAVFGGEGTSGNSGVGLFGAVVVQPKGARFYRSQVTEEELRLATRYTTDAGQPVVDYEARYPDDCASNGVWCQEGKAGRPILNMVDKRRIIHGEVNAIIVGPEKDGRFPQCTKDPQEHNGEPNAIIAGSGKHDRFPECDTYPLESKGLRNPTLPNRLEPFREFVSVFHDENAATQAFPYFFEHPELSHTLHGVRDAFMINYGSGGIGSEIIANRLKAGPMQDCLDCAYEEFFLSSFTVGDAATLVDNPANMVISQCQPEFVNDPRYEEEFKKFCVQPKKQRAQQAFYPHDPANVHHSYIGDFVKFRNLHSGKEQHIFHLHNHQWLFNANDDNSNYIDAQGIGPGSGYTYEIAFGGSGNRNKTVGDAIFHCHFYPHFAQGMWYMWRIHDVYETGTPLAVSRNKTRFHDKPYGLQYGKPAKGARALPDGEIVAGTPIPAVVPLPGKAMPVMPGEVIVEPRVVEAEVYGSVAKVLDRDRNPGFPFWIAGIETSMGTRPTTPPLDMSEIPGVVSGHDGGLPRHALGGFSEGGEAEQTLDRISAAKEVHVAKPIYYPEDGTDIEKVAMKFHAQRKHKSFSFDLGGNISPAMFVTNGQKPVPGAPYNDPCMDDTGRPLLTGEDGRFFGGRYQEYISVIDVLPGGVEFGADRPRVYKGANLQLDVVFNKIGYHYPQQRILTLWEDVAPLLDKERPPEPLVLRMNTFDCAMYAHANLIPKEFMADDYQITTPTDVIGQHIHLPKWDLTSADGSANGWNYEDGTFAPGAVRERISAINHWNQRQTDQGKPVVPLLNGSTAPLVPQAHPYFGNLEDHQSPDCLKKWHAVAGDYKEFSKRYGHPGDCDWFGARTTLQRWFSDPIVNAGGVHRGLGITFTHDHLGPSTHQQLGLYATMLTEPPGSEWQHNETGELLYDTSTRKDGGPTSWQAVITGKDGKPLDIDQDDRDDSHREFFLQYGDFQHAYQKGHYYGVNEEGVSWHYDSSAKPDENSFRYAINPSVRKPANSLTDIIAYEPTCPGGHTGIAGAVYNNSSRPPRPCPEAISADDVGMMLVNYRSEPIAARVYDPDKPAIADGKKGDQASGFSGDLAFAMQSRTDRAISVLNGVGGENPSDVTSRPHYAVDCASKNAIKVDNNGDGTTDGCYRDINFSRLKGDPFTPIMRAYSGDMVKVKVQAGSHEHEHNVSLNAMNWLQGGSGFGQAPHSGWRSNQNAGLSEQFTFTGRITDYETKGFMTDRMYTIDSSQDGLWNGTWGVLRTLTRRDARKDKLTRLPNNPLPVVLAPDEGMGRLNDCPDGVDIIRYDISAVLANQVLENVSSVRILDGDNGTLLDPEGGTLVYNPRQTKITLNIEDEDGNITRKKYGTGPLHDPTAILFVRDEDLDPTTGKLKAGRPLEPVVLRAAAGQCVQVSLRNRLPRSRLDMPDLEGYTALTGLVPRDSGLASGSKMTSFNNNLIRPSNHIGLHPQLVHYDVQAYDGNNIGVNTISTVPPSGRKIYQWYAGELHFETSPQVCTTQQNNALDSYVLLNEVARRPNLRPLSDLLTTDRLRTLLLTRFEADRSLLERFRKPAKDADPDEASAEALQLAEDIVLLADQFNCLETGPEGERKQPQVHSARLAVRKPLGAAPIVGSEWFYDRGAVLERRRACLGNTELAEEVSSTLRQHEFSAEMVEVYTSLVMNSFFYEADGLDPGQSSQSAYAWRQKEYPPLTPKTTRLARIDGKNCRFVPIEYGATNLSPPDRIKQGQKGAIGALVVEPEKAKWDEYYDDRALDRQDPGPGQSNTRATRMTADVRYPVNGKIRSFRDLVMVHQKGLNLHYGGGDAVANLAAEKENAREEVMVPGPGGDTPRKDRSAPEDAHDAGHMALNYGSEPMWFRFGIAPDAPFGREGFAGLTHAWQAFSNDCCTAGSSADSADANVGEPYVPIMTANAGQEMRIRTLMPTGIGRGTVTVLQGHQWPRDPYLAEKTIAGMPAGNKPADWGVASKCIGDNAMAMYLGAQESVTPMAHFDMVFPSAGGEDAVTGDFLWRDHGGYGVTNGLWAIVRVQGGRTDDSAFYSPGLRASCE